MGRSYFKKPLAFLLSLMLTLSVWAVIVIADGAAATITVIEPSNGKIPSEGATVTVEVELTASPANNITVVATPDDGRDSVEGEEVDFDEDSLTGTFTIDITENTSAEKVTWKILVKDGGKTIGKTKLKQMAGDGEPPYYDGNGGPYTVINDERDWNGFSMLQYNGSVWFGDIYLGEVLPESEFLFYPVHYFEGTASSGVYNDTSVNASFGLEDGEGDLSETDRAELDDAAPYYPWEALSGVKLRNKLTKGSEAIRDVEFIDDGGVAAIRIRTVQRLETADKNGVDFELVVFPAVGGKAWNREKKGMVIAGTCVNEITGHYAVLDDEDDWRGFSRLEYNGDVREDTMPLGNQIVPDSEFWFYPVHSFKFNKIGSKVSVDMSGDSSFGFENNKGNLTQTEISALESAAPKYPWESLSGDVKLRTRVYKGVVALRGFQFMDNGGVAGIKLRITQRLKSVEKRGVDFGFIIYPVVDGDTWDYETNGMEIIGTVRNDVRYFDTGDRSVYLYDNIIAQAEEDVPYIMYELGPADKDRTVVVHGRAKRGDRFWGYATSEATSAQQTVMSRYGISAVYNLDWINLDKVARYVTLDVDPLAYIYDSNLNYLGRGSGQLSLKSTYYISTRQIKDNNRKGGDRSSSGGGGGGSSYSGGGSSGASAAPAAVTQTQAVSSVRAAIAAGGGAKLKNAGAISLSAMNAMAQAAGAQGVTVNADTLGAYGSVDVRLSFDPGNATKNINLSASTTSGPANTAKAAFTKYFANDVSTVSLAHEGDFGMTVRVAAKLDEKLRSSQDLRFYSYNPVTNTFRPMPDTEYRIDANGYVHFNTAVGGTIVISDGPLTK